MLDRTLWVDLDSLSDDPEGTPDDGLPPHRDLVGTVWGPSARVEVYLDRVGASGLPPWQIAGSTVRQIPTLYKDFGYGRLTALLPAPFFDIQFLDVQLWQWIGILVLALVAVLVAWIATWVTLHTLRAERRVHLDLRLRLPDGGDDVADLRRQRLAQFQIASGG